MLQCPISGDKPKLLGQRVLIKENKYGTVHYFGKIHFAQGLWCGIELDEEVGENDGIVNNIRYFSCKKKYGIFIPASDVNLMSYDDLGIDMSISELMSEDRTEKPCDKDFSLQNYDFSVSSDSHLASSQNSYQKNKSYVIPTEFNRKLPIINEDSEYPKSVNFSSFSKREDLSKCENIFKFEQAPISSAQSFSQETGVIQQIEENNDSDDSLGILPHLLEDLSSFDDLFDANEMSINLNTTIPIEALHYSGEKLKESYMSQQEAEELATSPICFVPNILFTESDESPVCINTSVPKYASTPKHETDYSYVIDDAVPSPHKFSFGSQFNNVYLENEKNIESTLNKTKAIEENSEYVLPVITNKQIPVNDENRNPEKKFLNETFSILDSLKAKQILLNKTFNNLNISSDETCALPSHDKSNKNKVNIQHHLIPEEFHTIDFDLQDKYENVFSENQNVLNVTCGILKPSYTSMSLSENLECKNAKSISMNILNTTISYPQEAEGNIIVEETAKLNATYGIIEEPVELERTIAVLQPLYANMSETEAKNELKDIIETLRAANSPFSTDEFDMKKNTRKSVGSFGQTSTSDVEVKNKNYRRNSASGNLYRSSKINDMPINAYDKDLSNRHFIDDCARENSLNRYYAKSGNSIKSMSTYPSLKSESEVIKDSHLLNETIILDPIIPEVGKTVQKKSRRSMSFYEDKSSLDTCEASLFKTHEEMYPFDKRKSSYATVESEITQLSNIDSSVSSNKNQYSADSSMAVGKLQFIRKPESYKISSKTGSKNCPSFKNTANLYKSNRGIPVVSKISVPSFQSAGYAENLIQKNNTKVISGYQRSYEQTTETVVSSKDLPRKSFNQKSSFLQEQNWKDGNLKSDHQSKSEQTSKLSSLSKIPSVSQSTRKQVSGVKSSLIPKRAESTSYKRKSQYDSR